MQEYIRRRNPDAKVIPVSAKTGEGILEWTDWLRNRLWNGKKRNHGKHNYLT